MRKTMKALVLVTLFIGLTPTVAAGNNVTIRSYPVDTSPLSASCQPPAFTGTSLETEQEQTCAIEVMERSIQAVNLMRLCGENRMTRLTCRQLSDLMDVLVPLHDQIVQTATGQASAFSGEPTLTEVVEMYDEVLKWRNPTLLKLPYESRLKLTE